MAAGAGAAAVAAYAFARKRGDAETDAPRASANAASPTTARAEYRLRAELAASPTGVYLWGDNSHGLISATAGDARVPTRVPFFDGKTPSGVAVSPRVAVAVVDGALWEWSSPTDQRRVLDGVRAARVSGQTVVALRGAREVLAWDAGGTPEPLVVPALGWFERIEDLEIGEAHVAVRTSKGAVLTGLLREVAAHDGQLGQAAHSALDPAPPARVLRHVKLLPGPAAQIACGLRHTLVRTADGVYAFGSNMFGQLALPYSYATVQTSAPTRLPLVVPKDPITGARPAASLIAAGGNVSYFVIGGLVLSAGAGNTAQLGSGSLAHVQASPVQVRALCAGAAEAAVLPGVPPSAGLPRAWSVSATHTFAQLAGPTQEWVAWGSNAHAELAPGGGHKLRRPTPVRQLLAGALPCNTFVAGDGVSAAFTRA